MLENRDPVAIILIQRLSVLFYYPCGSLFRMHVMCGCLRVCVWMVVVSSAGMESRSLRQSSYFNYPLVTLSVASKNETESN